jgi:hypothetical protein
VYGKVQEAVARDEAFAKLWAQTSTFAELTGRDCREIASLQSRFMKASQEQVTLISDG